MINVSGLSLTRVIMYDVLFSLFACFVEPELLPELKKITDPGQPNSNLFIGLLLVSALVLEVPGVYLKFRVIAARMLLEKRGKPGEPLKHKGGTLIIILHAAIGVILMIFAFQALGYRIHGNANLFRIFFLAALAREGLIIYFMFTVRIPVVQPSLGGLKNNIADLMVFFYGITALTSTWRNITSSDKPLDSGSIGMILLFLFFSAILFLIYYLGSNMTTFYEGMIMAKTRRQRSYRILSLLLVTASVLYPMFNYGNSEKQFKPGFNETEKIEMHNTEEKLIMKYNRDKKPGHIN